MHTYNKTTFTISAFVGALLLATNSNSANAANPDTGDWYLRSAIGLSQMSDLNATATAIDNHSGPVNINLDSGFSAGLGLGYQLNPNWTIELYWEYRGNDSQTTVTDTTTANQSTFDGGNYASNLFFLNGLYWFESQGNWQPYLGAGLSWVQELDIDLERNGVEWSYSSDGDTGFQAFAGVSYQLTPTITLHGEARYGSITGINLANEQGQGELSGLDYQTTTWQVGLSYSF